MSDRKLEAFWGFSLGDLAAKQAEKLPNNQKIMLKQGEKSANRILTIADIFFSLTGIATAAGIYFVVRAEAAKFNQHWSGVGHLEVWRSRCSSWVYFLLVHSVLRKLKWTTPPNRWMSGFIWSRLKNARAAASNGFNELSQSAAV